MVLVMKLGMVGAVKNPGDDNGVNVAGLSQGTRAENPGDGVAAGMVFGQLSPCESMFSYVAGFCSYFYGWL